MLKFLILLSWNLCFIKVSRTMEHALGAWRLCSGVDQSPTPLPLPFFSHPQPVLSCLFPLPLVPKALTVLARCSSPHLDLLPLIAPCAGMAMGSMGWEKEGGTCILPLSSARGVLTQGRVRSGTCPTVSWLSGYELAAPWPVWQDTQWKLLSQP